MNAFSRTELLIGKEGITKLQQAKVAIFGIGGVGSFVAEGLVRAGIGKFVLIDADTISLTNLNRQIHATYETIGKSKVEVMKQRMLSINPQVEIQCQEQFYLPDSKNTIIDETFSYVVDAVDTVTAKIEIITRAKNCQVPIISCMGTGNKLNPTMLEVTDISKTSVCPLAKVIRKELKNRKIEQVKVVYSKEEPIKPIIQEVHKEKQVPGSVSFVPSVAGLIIASEVVKDIVKIR